MGGRKLENQTLCHSDLISLILFIKTPLSHLALSITLRLGLAMFRPNQAFAKELPIFDCTDYDMKNFSNRTADTTVAIIWMVWGACEDYFILLTQWSRRLAVLHSELCYFKGTSFPFTAQELLTVNICSHYRGIPRKQSNGKLANLFYQWDIIVPQHFSLGRKRHEQKMHCMSFKLPLSIIVEIRYLYKDLQHHL